MIRLLLVDDEAMVRAGLRHILEAETDLAVIGEAADGLEAIEAAIRLQPDVILMDVRMPRMDGVEAYRRRVQEAGVKVVVLTTFDLDDHFFPQSVPGRPGSCSRPPFDEPATPSSNRG